jgi:hypothetical protein
MGARWYDPEIGHFISADTVVPKPGNPLTFDRYAYVKNCPLRFIDPSGHCAAESATYSQRIHDALIGQCNEIRTSLEEQYNVRITGKWSVWEMKILRTGIGLILKAFSRGGVANSEHYYADQYSELEIHRDREFHYSDDTESYWNASAQIDGSYINLFNGTFYNKKPLSETKISGRRDTLNIFTTIAHEHGHIWDFRGFSRRSNGLMSVVDGSGGKGRYTTEIESQDPFRSKGGPLEDWAVTWAEFVINPMRLKHEMKIRYVFITNYLDHYRSPNPEMD